MCTQASVVMVLTLPPDDDSRGRPHGHFEVTLSAPVWTAAVTDEATHAHIRFWGHCRSHEQVIAVPQEQAKAFSTVPITVGACALWVLDLPWYLSRYSRPVASTAEPPNKKHVNLFGALQNLPSSCPISKRYMLSASSSDTAARMLRHALSLWYKSGPVSSM